MSSRFQGVIDVEKLSVVCVLSVDGTESEDGSKKMTVSELTQRNYL